MEEIKAKAVKIGLNAAEDLVKDCLLPYVAIKLKEKNPKYMMIYNMLVGPVRAMADKIDGEEG